MNSPAEQQQEENLQDILSDQFDKMEAETESEEHAEMEVSQEETSEISEDIPETHEDEEVAELEADAAEEQLAEEVAEAEESDYTEPAPERWPDEIKEVYNGLPPVARKAMLEGIYKPMQRTYTQSTQELAQMRNAINPMLESMNQYRSDFERMGVNPVEAFRTQMAWASHLAKVGPEQGLRDMANAYGIDPAKQAVQQTQNEYLTPAERAMKAQIDGLQQTVAQQQQHQTQSAQEAEANRQTAFKAEIERNYTAFANEKTEDGQLAHPHIEKVANGIAGVIRGGMVKQTDDYGQPLSMRDQLAQAYEMACNLDPSIRTPAVDTRQVKRARAAQKVGVVTKEPAGQVSENEDMNISDFIAKQYDILDRKAM
jgi:hypothetical protein